MCGRYVSARGVEVVAAAFDAQVPADLEPPPPRWNVAPTQDVLAVLARPPREDREAPPVRQVRTVRWGLVPSWSKDARGAARMINARVETAARLPAYRRAAASRRCLLPADGWYEWQPQPQPQPGSTARKPPTQPFYLRPDDGAVLGLAGLYELWRDPAADPEAPGGGWLTTFTVLTTTAEGPSGQVHDRCPLVVAQPGDLGAWLDPALGADDALPLLVPATLAGVTPVPVSRAVGQVRHDSPELVEPVPLPDAWA